MIFRTFKILWRIFVISISTFDWLTSSRRDGVHSHKISSNKVDELFVYVHWSHDLIPTAGEIELLQQTKKLGINILIVFNVDNFEKAQVGLLNWDGLYDSFIVRKNNGRDLAAYRVAAKLIDSSKLKSIYFFNNSILWLPVKIKSFIEKFTDVDEKIYSATVSYHPIKHMQSFAIAAKGEGIPRLLYEITKLRNTRLKITTVTFGEIRISKKLTKHGVQFSNGLYQYSHLIKQALNKTVLLSQPAKIVNPSIEFRLDSIRSAIANGIPLNPTHHTWLELYNLGFPGLKKDLVSKNKSRIPDLVVYERYLHKKDADTLNMENLGFLTYPKTSTDKIRRKMGI